ncbi:uncharacterized protein [Palaemon carinicauda]|uniref:uncharacterized protein n=1 Tax=Palaemon carinicauda TaxID=392227 RepID=UPI0035B5E43F
MTNFVKVLEALRRHNLKVNLAKCQMFQPEFQFLGHMLTNKGISPMADKIEAIRTFPRPLTPKQVRSFLGLASYYRRFIKDFGKISRPLDKLRKTESFEWTREHEDAFQKLKLDLS